MADEGLKNLKKIHQIQVGGAIQNLLRQLRSSKISTEEFLKDLNTRKKELSLISEKQENEVIEVNSKPEEIKSDVLKVEPVELKSDNKNELKDLPEEKPIEQNNLTQSKTQQQGGVFRRDGGTQQRIFNQNHITPQGQKQFPQRTYDPNRKPYDPSRKSFDSNQKSFDPNRKPFDPNRKPFDPNRKPFPQKDGFKNVGQRPASSFIASKGNSLRVFSNLESSSVLAQPERSFGNKNKSQRNVEEKNRAAKKDKGFTRKNIIINNSDGFEETTMGSRKLIKSKKKEDVFVAPQVENAVVTTETLTVKQLSEKIGKPVTEIIKKLMILGIMATINSLIDFTTAELIASEMGIKLEQKLSKSAEEELTQFASVEKDDEKNLKSRPPVVAVMGHVDHGKTSLLDIIRKTNVVAGEAGGITQKIGAYQVIANGGKITFIDTPGHAAFTSMRARGAKITDIAILVVAADDGIMPQTIEAINHIKAAEVPMIVAVNKMDKPGANPERVKQQLAENGVLPEEWGGDTILVPVSAKTGVGIDNLLNTVLLVAEMQELKANPKRRAVATVIEAELDKNRGPVATLLIQNGTLKVGDHAICGIIFGKVKAMYDENGNTVKEATPSTPVSVLGFEDVPQSGDQVVVVSNKLSKQVIQERKTKIKIEKADTTSGVTLEEFMSKVNEGKFKTLNIIIKADLQGSVEALKQSLTVIANEEVKVNCVHSATGPVTESDLILAKTSKSIVINFNLKVMSKIKAMAEKLGVELKEYKIIYEVVDDITKAITGMVTAKFEKQVIGHAEVRVVFKLSSSGVIAGSYVLDGKVIRHGGVRVLRGNEEIIDTTIEALKIQKDDKSEVNHGFECGIKLKDFNNLKEGDILEVYQNIRIN